MFSGKLTTYTSCYAEIGLEFTTPRIKWLAETMLRARYSTTWLLIIIFVLACPFAAVFYLQRRHEKINAGLTQSMAGYLVIRYMEEHNDAWPSEWNDLKPYFDHDGANPASQQAWESFQNRVHIDFSVNVECLRTRCQAGDTDFRVIFTHIDPAGYEKRMNPNTRIYNYLRTTRKRSSSLEPSLGKTNE